MSEITRRRCQAIVAARSGQLTKLAGLGDSLLLGRILDCERKSLDRMNLELANLLRRAKLINVAAVTSSSSEVVASY
jgi:hypothetical protein